MIKDDIELKTLLIRQGMDEVDASTLIKIAKFKKTSVSWQFFWSLSGLYWYTFCLMVVYWFFTRSMDEKEYVLFTIIFFSLMLIAFLFTPFFRRLFWSVRVLFALKGR